MFLRVVGREITLVAAWEKRMVADGSAMLDGLAMDRRIRGCDGRTKKRRGTAAELESTIDGELSSDPACSFKKECLVWIPTHKRADSAGNEPILLLWAICIRPN